MTKKWAVLDNYEELEVIGVYNTKAEALKAITRRVRETDGECACVIIDLETCSIRVKNILLSVN